MPDASVVDAMSAARVGMRAMLAAGGVRDSVAAIWLAPLTSAADRFEINTRLRRIHWLATLVHESTGFMQLEENLNYSAKALYELFPLTPDRPWGFTPQEAADFARKPREIANRIYADRNGNGNEASGEGWFYRGRGPIQTTGRTNYQSASGPCGVDLLPEPELLLMPEHGATAAAFFWQTRGCNPLADRDDTAGIRRLVNGRRMLGLDHVVMLVSRMKLS